MSMKMHWTHLRTADLNLLLALHLLLEERQVKRAADRFGLSQPAMSRVLQRLRETFDDDLLIRTADGYEPTLRAERIRGELYEILWRAESILRNDAFDAATASGSFAISCSDFSTFIQGPALARLFRDRAPNLSLELVTFSDTTFADTEKGKIDLVLWVDDAPEPLVSEPLFVEEFVCVVSRHHPALKRPLTLKRYFECPHVMVTILSGRQTILDARIERLGGKRDAVLKVPYFAAALAALPHTDLIATVPKRFALAHRENSELRMIPAPSGLESVCYLMAWHPRVTGDPAHSWLRSIVKESATMSEGAVVRA
jgi:DNA-binding transcriptional LysR family regulator